MQTTVTIKTRGGERTYYRKICPVCKHPFHAERSDALTCSNKCRQKLYRRRKRSARAKHREKCVQHNLPMPESDFRAKIELFKTRHG